MNVYHDHIFPKTRRTFVGSGRALLTIASLVASGVTQSPSRSPPVSPELGLIHQKKLSAISLSLRYEAYAFSQTPFLPSVYPPHYPVTTAAPPLALIKPNFVFHIAGMFAGNVGSLK